MNYTYNIDLLSIQSKTKIYIFDEFDKILKFIGPNTLKILREFLKKKSQ
jgi:hypothetical protein